jgi:glycosyltransferase involved in cell wall biosynthesis
MGEGTPDLGAERATTFPLPPHPLADAVTPSSKLAKASLPGEGRGEGPCGSERVVVREVASLVTGVCVVIPVLNERETIGGVIGRVPTAAVDMIIAADGGSGDGTAEIASAHGARVLNAGKGYGRACIEAVLAAGDGCRIVVFMDGDGSDFPEELPKLVAPILAGTHDFVIASRTRGRREPGSMAWHQLASGIMIGGLAGLLYGFRYTDMCAFRAIRRDALIALGMREMTYGWNLEMQMKAARAGLRILEIPVPYACRAGGRSKVAGSLRGSLRAGSRILLTFARVALQPKSYNRQQPGLLHDRF